MANSSNHHTLLRDYFSLRRAIGVIGIALPFTLAFGWMSARGTGIERSISAYYHTGMRDVFVGALCAMAVFFWFYHGYDRRDNRAGNLACLFALGVAWFPTTPLNATTSDRTIGAIHYGFAAALFLTLAYFCLVLFRKTNTRNPTERKLQRNVVYRVCGVAILSCIALMGVLAPLPEDLVVKQYSPVFWLEATAIIAFGVSWLTKGEAILGDVPVTEAEPARATVM